MINNSEENILSEIYDNLESGKKLSHREDYLLKSFYQKMMNNNILLEIVNKNENYYSFDVQLPYESDGVYTIEIIVKDESKILWFEGETFNEALEELKNDNRSIIKNLNYN